MKLVVIEFLVVGKGFDLFGNPYENMQIVYGEPANGIGLATACIGKNDQKVKLVPVEPFVGFFVINNRHIQSRIMRITVFHQPLKGFIAPTNSFAKGGKLRITVLQQPFENFIISGDSLTECQKNFCRIIDELMCRQSFILLIKQ